MTTLLKYNNNKLNMVVFDEKWKKYNEIQLTKNKMDLNNRKMNNHPPSLYYCRDCAQILYKSVFF